MFNCLRMDIYRTIHSKITWVFMIIIVAMTAMTSGAMWYLSTDAFANQFQTLQSVSGASGLEAEIANQIGLSTSADSATAKATNPSGSLLGGSLLSYFGLSLVSGGALSLLVSVYVALFLAAEFETGFVKNIFSAQIGRGAFFASKLILLLIITVVFCAFSFGLLYLGSMLAGLTFSPTMPLDMALWLALITLVIFAYAMITALATWLMRTKVAGILVALFVSGGIASSLISLFCSFFPALKRVPDFFLSSCMQSLGNATDVVGPLGTTHIIGVSAVFVVVCAIGSFIALKKKDIN